MNFLVLAWRISLPIQPEKCELIVLALLLGVLAVFWLTPVAIRLACKAGVFGKSQAHHLHTTPTPRWGGLAMYTAFLLAVLVEMCFDPNLANKRVIGILIGGAVITAVGALDDKFNVPARAKLLGQILAATLLASPIFGVRLVAPVPVFFSLDLKPLLGSLLTIIWVVSITNTINLIDGLDGLAAGISGIAALTFVIIAVWVKGSLGEAILAAAVAGVCLGFLRYNFNPARVFMGDAGSHFLGFTIGALSILQNWKVATGIAFAIPVLVLAVPIFDTGFAIIRRLRRGRPIFSADQGHLHHRLLNLGLDHRSVVLTIYCMTAVGCALALWLAHARIWPSPAPVPVQVPAQSSTLVPRNKTLLVSPSHAPRPGTVHRSASTMWRYHTKISPVVKETAKPQKGNIIKPPGE